MRPNFLIAGAAKSGTTSLFHYLNQHPEVYIPQKKECRFFSDIAPDFVGFDSPHGQKVIQELRKSIVRDVRQYAALFEPARRKKAVGDASPDYLFYYKKSIPNIKRLLGDAAKIIIILRNPIERAFSMYLHLKRERLDEASFEEALDQEQARIAHNWWWGFYLVTPGFYYDQVKAYVEQFPKVKVCLYEDLEADPQGLMRDLFAFVGVRADFTPNISVRYNVSGLKQSRLAKALASCPWMKPIVERAQRSAGTNGYVSKHPGLLTHLLCERSAMPKRTEARLKHLYRDDVTRLGRLIGRDLTGWVRA